MGFLNSWRVKILIVLAQAEIQFALEVMWMGFGDQRCRKHPCMFMMTWQSTFLKNPYRKSTRQIQIFVNSHNEEKRVPLQRSKWLCAQCHILYTKYLCRQKIIIIINSLDHSCQIIKSPFILFAVPSCLGLFRSRHAGREKQRRPAFPRAKLNLTELFTITLKVLFCYLSYPEPVRHRVRPNTNTSVMSAKGDGIPASMSHGHRDPPRAPMSPSNGCTLSI